MRSPRNPSFPDTLARALIVLGAVTLIAGAVANTAWGQEAARPGPPPPDGGPGNPRPEPPIDPTAGPSGEFRTIDGWGNNAVVLDMGATATPLARMADADYADGVETPAGPDRASARVISNIVCAQTEARPNAVGASDYIWQWGQFVDHDIDLTEGADPAEAMDIEVPPGDPWFDPFVTGGETIGMDRSAWDPDSGSGVGNPRQQMNSITSWIDASNVYGSDQERATALRTNDGTGRLRTSEGDLLPWNEEGLDNAGGTSSALFLAGDIRANEQVGLTAMHTLFVREHNRLAERAAKRNRDMDGDTIYEYARRLVGAEMQAITFREFLPVLLGPGAIAPWAGYDPSVDGRIRNEFSTASYRFGHSMLSDTLLRLDKDGTEIAEGHLALRDAFFNPTRITDEGGIDPILRGLAAQRAQSVDPYLVDDVRNFLFGPPGAGGFDLASLNIQRGRDHGLASYNDMRRAMGLGAAADFADVTSDPALQVLLASAYVDVEDIDLWVGGLAEDPVAGAMVGPLLRAVLVAQFSALRDGDRYWYEAILERKDRRYVEKMTLSRIIRRNTGIGRELPADAFRTD
jgi:peroxidase